MFPVDAKDRTLIHLKDYQNHQHSMVVPYEITQGGIADSIGITRGHLTQVINRMYEDGLVVEKVRHVEGTSRRRKVYFISPKGIELEQKLREELESQEIVLITSQERKRMKIKDIGMHLQTENPLMKVIKHADTDGTVDLSTRKTAKGAFVGREKEFETLKKELKKVKDGNTSTIFLTGVTGIGKTRLANEFRSYAENHGFRVLSGKAHFETSGPYLPFRRALRTHGKDGDDFLDFMLSHGRQRESANLQDRSAFETRRGVTFFEAKHRMEDISKVTPLVLHLDDMQWSDRASLQLLLYLTLNVRKEQILFLISYRQEDLGEDHLLNEICERLHRERDAKMIELRPLDINSTEKICRKYFDKRELPEGFVDVLQKKTDGIPLFTHEYLNELKENETTEISLKEDNVDLPSLIQEVIKKKMDRLPHHPLKLLQLGSVIGDEIPYELLRSISKLDELTLLDFIDILKGSDFWHEHDVTECFHFNHRSVQTAVYFNIPRLKRRALHGAVAEHILGNYGNETKNHYSILAFHYEKSGNIKKSISYYIEAGRYAEQVYAHENAIEFYKKCINLLKRTDSGEEMMKVLERLGDVHKVLGEYDDSRDYYQQGIDRLGKQNHPRLYRKIAESWLKQGEFDRVFDNIDRSLAQVNGDLTEKIRILQVKGWAEMQSGKHEEAMNSFKDCLYLAKEIGSEKLLGESLHNLGTISIRLGDYSTGKIHLEEAVSIRERIGDREGLARSLNNLGIIFEDLGELDRALETYQKSLEIQKEIGMKEAIATVYANMGIIQGVLGNNDKAEDLFKNSLDMFENMGDRRGMALSLSNLGKLYVHMGKIKQSLELNKKCLEISESIGYQRAIAMAFNHIGESYFLLGDLKTAEEYLEKSKDLCLQMGDRRGYASAIGNMGDIHCENGDLEKALDLFSQCIEVYENVGDLFETVNNQTRLAELHLLKGDYETAEGYAREALVMAEGKNNKLVTAIGHKVMGKIMGERGEIEKAVHHLQKAERMFRDLNNKPELCMIRFEISRMYHEEGNIERAIEEMKELENLFNEMNMKLWEKRCRDYIQRYLNN